MKALKDLKKKNSENRIMMNDEMHLQKDSQYEGTE